MSESDPDPMALVRKIQLKVEDTLAPLAREMRVMQWPAEYRAIMWEAVMLEARKRWETSAEERADA